MDKAHIVHHLYLPDPLVFRLKFWFQCDTMTKRPQEFWEAIKLIHFSELVEMQKFKRYQEYDGITYQDYRVGEERVKNIRRYVSKYIHALERLDEIDHEGLVVYDDLYIEVPRSLLHRERRIKLTREQLPNTHIECESGKIDGNFLISQAGWHKKSERVEYSCPSNIRHQEEIETLKKLLSTISEQDKRFLDEYQESHFRHPDFGWQATTSTLRFDLWRLVR